MAKARLVTRTEVLAYLEYANLGITNENMSDVLLNLIRVDVRTWLERSKAMKYNETIEDLDDFLETGYIWCASLCLMFERLSMMGLVEQSSGDVQTARAGDMITTFQRWQPMFFFAKGMARGFYELLPHLSYQMLAMQMIRSWKSWKFDHDHPNEVQFGSISARFDENLGYFVGDDGTVFE